MECIVSVYLDMAGLQAMRKIPMTMADWEKRLAAMNKHPLHDRHRPHPNLLTGLYLKKSARYLTAVKTRMAASIHLISLAGTNFWQRAPR